MHYVVYRAFCLLTPLAIGIASTQCPYPCWSEIAAEKFTYESFQPAPQPLASPPYIFAFPYPSQPNGAYSESCNAQENPDVDLYRYGPQTQSWTGPLTGPIYRNPAYLEVSPLLTGAKGIAVQLSYEGKIDHPTAIRSSIPYSSTRNAVIVPAPSSDSRTT